MTDEARVAAGPTLSLTGGGPFIRLLARLGLQSLRARLPALVAVAWVPLAVLSALAGTLSSGDALPFLRDPAPHVRFLAGLPLLLLVGLVIDPALGRFRRYLFESGVLPEESRGRYDQAVARTGAARDRGWVEVVLLALAYLTVFLVVDGGSDPRLAPGQATWLAANDAGGLRFSPAGWWYFLVSVPLYQFVLYRWVWRYLLWTSFLWRLSRMDLQLEPTHPDHAGGLGMLQPVQTVFTGVGVAVAASMSGMLAHDILYEGSSLAGERATVAGFCVVSLLVLLLPTLLFAPSMGRAKRKGLASYGVLGARLARRFRRRWTSEDAGGPALIDSSDASSAADFVAEFESIQKMRPVPIGLASCIRMLTLLALPFVPLALTENSVRDALAKLARLLG